jgi:hypothetical protein
LNLVPVQPSLFDANILSDLPALKRRAKVIRTLRVEDLLLALKFFEQFPMSQRQYNSFSEFWPHYVAEHSNPRTRLLHLIGTTIAIGSVVFLIAIGKWWLFPLALIPGYGAAWIGHFFIEKNKPATFQYPLWSFMGDYKMIWMMLTGRMKTEVERSGRKAGASPPSSP